MDHEMKVIGAAIADGVNTTPAKISIVQIWNPASSGLLLKVYSLDCAWNGTAAAITSVNGICGWDFNFNSEPLGEVARYLLAKDASCVAPSPIEMRTLQCASPYPPSRLFYESWAGGPLNSQVTEFWNDPLLLRPGNGILVRSALPNIYNIVSVQGETAAVA